MSDVLQYKNNDIVPIQITGPLDLVVENREFFEAELGDLGGTIAISLLQPNRKTEKT